MDRNKILEFMRPGVKEATIDGHRVHIGQWSLLESDAIIMAQNDFREDKKSISELYATVVVCSLCDESGVRVLNESDIPEIAKSSALKLKAIYSEAMIFNGVQRAETDEDPEKN